MMTRNLTTIFATFFLILISLDGIALAQTAGHRAVRRQSGVTGLELGLEGSLEVPRGGTLRWLLTAHEVVGLRDLRPAEGATISLTTSLDPTAVAAEATTDSFGRAQLELDIPDDGPDSFRAVIVVNSSDELQRRFELTVRTSEPRSLHLFSARSTVRPGGRLQLFGRLAFVTTNRPITGESVEVLLRDGQHRPLGAPARVTTDEAGLFAHTFSVPSDVEGQLIVDALVDDEDHPLSTVASVMVAEPEPAQMLLAISPSTVIVRPSQQIDLDVVVRTPNGRPIQGAVVALEERLEGEERRRARTDARGRTSLSWTAPRQVSGLEDQHIAVIAEREGFGLARNTTRIRVTATEWAAALAVEGGTLVPTLGGHLWVRATRADGSPAPADVPVELRGSRLRGGALSSRTDQSGVARFDVSLVQAPASATDRCGGDNATAVDIVVGTGPGRATREACLPLDPDATARVRLDSVLAQPGGRVRVEVTRSSLARQLPVSVALLSRRNQRLFALASRIMAPEEDTIELELPTDVVGEVLVRARPLHGPERHEVRGGMASLWVLPGEAMDVQVELDTDEDRARVGFVGPAEGPRSVYLVALPIDTARALAFRLRQASLGPLNDLRQPATSATEALIAAALAAGTPRDRGAPAILRRFEGVVPVPAPESPERLGLLRDPWRARARFVTGRLALFFRAIEAEVSQAIPDRLDDVAVRDGGAWRFNSQIVETVAASASLGSEGVTGMGGEPLTIEALQQFDPAFSYNAVARRITRERLFRLILALRQFVNTNGFDLPWSRLGDPSEWLRSLPGQSVPGGRSLQRQDLVDGWGRPFMLRRAGGGRTRFAFVSPLGGWEIISQGPDGRIGNADDLWDPTARVLPTGSAYAEAVGEDLLLARLRGVELGRATTDVLRSTGGEYARPINSVPPSLEEATEELALQLWSMLPALLEADQDALALRRPSAPDDGALGRVLAIPASGDDVRLVLDEEPRTWGTVAYAWTHDGFPAIDLSTTIGGAPLIVEARFPERLRQSEPVSVQVQLTNLTNSTQSIRITPSARGPITAHAPEPLSLGPETAGTVDIRLEGSSPGDGLVVLELSDQNGRALRSINFSIRINSGLAPIRLRAGAAMTGRRWRTRLEIPRDATSPTGRVVVISPQGLSSDPDLDDVRRRDPALLAWANTLSGRALSDADRAALDRAQAPDGIVDGAEHALSTACSLVTWSALGADDDAAAESLRRAGDVLPELPAFEDHGDALAGRIRMASAVLAAIAPGGVPELDDHRSHDVVAQYAATLRAELRRTIHSAPEEPALLARAAAALLLADPRDGHGRAMVERAEAHLEEIEGIGAIVARTERRPELVDALTATLALAVALHQMERDDRALNLVRGAFAHENVLTRVGGETTFWFLAAAAYGAMGTGVPEQVRVSAGGEERTVDLSSGRAVVPIEELDAGRARAVTIERIGGPSLLVRAEVVMGRRFDERDDGPLGLEILGDLGRGGELAALELSVTSPDQPVSRPVIDIQLPAGVVADDSLIETLESSSAIRAAEDRHPGFLRIWLQDIVEGATSIVPLPLRWTAQGELHGLGVIAYPQSSPRAMTVLPPRRLEVE